MNTRQSALFLVLLFVVLTSHARDSGYIEYSTRLLSNTVDTMQSIAISSPVNARRAGPNIYGSIELIWYRFAGDDNTLFNARVAMGLSNHWRLAPFVEIGTNLVDFLTLWSDNSLRDCTETPCDPDIDIKAGVRWRINKQASLGVYYQRINFGDYNAILIGNHSLAGATIGWLF